MNKQRLIILLLVIFIFGVGIKFFLQDRNQKSQTILFEINPDEKDKIGQSIEVSEGKHPYGFPVEILNYQDKIIDGQRYISGYCRWHTAADSVMGGKIAVAPVVLYRLDTEVKKLEPIGETITKRKDGYFQLISPSVEGEYTVGVRIERAENCPEKFKVHVPRQEKKERKKEVI
jgi:hypothetical protein